MLTESYEIRRTQVLTLAAALFMLFLIPFSTFLIENDYYFYYSFGDRYLSSQVIEETIGDNYETRAEEIVAVTHCIYRDINYVETGRRFLYALRSEKGACGSKSYMEYLILKNRGYDCEVIRLNVTKEDRVYHGAVGIVLDGEYFVADPTNNLFTTLRRYLSDYGFELTPYWKWKLRGYIEK